MIILTISITMKTSHYLLLYYNGYQQLPTYQIPIAEPTFGQSQLLLQFLRYHDFIFLFEKLFDLTVLAIFLYMLSCGQYFSKEQANLISFNISSFYEIDHFKQIVQNGLLHLLFLFLKMWEYRLSNNRATSNINYKHTLIDS